MRCSLSQLQRLSPPPQNAQQFHSTRAYLGPRQWSPLATWTFRYSPIRTLPGTFTRMGKEPLRSFPIYIARFRLSIQIQYINYSHLVIQLQLHSYADREFNELPHIFEERLLKSLEPTAAYLASFRHPPTETLARLVAYLCGSIVAVLLLCSLLGEGILLYVRVRQHCTAL